MLPFAGGMMMGGRSIGFVGATTRSGPGTIAWPAGVEVGDYALIFVAYNDVRTQSGFATSSVYSSSTYLNVHHKQLVLADISIPPTVPYALDTVHVVVYRGVTAATVKSSTASGASDSTLNIAGFTKAAGCKGIVNAAIDRAWAGVAAGAPPAYMQTRTSNVVASYHCVKVADLLNPGAYTSGDAFAWTGFNATTYAQCGFAIELT